MKRTPIKDRELPNYSKNEELANTITHIIGIILGIIILIITTSLSIKHHNNLATITSIIYGVSMITLYTMSSIYHGLPKGYAKKVMQVVDHCTIYFLIAGTYTPIVMVKIREVNPKMALVIMIIEWALAAVAILCNCIDLKKFFPLSMACYIGLGWCILIDLKDAIETMTLQGFLWLLSGGIAYTIGAILYGIGKKKKYFHSVFHIFVLLGSLLQAISIINYVL